MMVKRAVRGLLCCLGLIGVVTLQASAAEQGYLCCTLQVDDGWISDINLRSEGGKAIKVGTPVQVLGFGRQRVKLLVDGKEMALGNDYSRALDLAVFRDRYVVTENPLDALQSAPPEVQGLVDRRQVAPGMDRRFVLMSLGYPVASNTPNLDDKRWTYAHKEEERRFWVLFDDAGLVESVRGDDETLAEVAPSMLTTDRLAQARKGEPPCQINIYHAMVQGWNASREKVIVYVGDQQQGRLSPGETICVNSLQPGRYAVSVRGTHLLLPQLWKGGEFIVNVAADGPPAFLRYQKVMTGVGVLGAVMSPESKELFDEVSEAQWRSRQ